MPPGETDGLEVWVLGSSSNGAGAAAYLGLPFAFAHFITPDFGPQIVRSYRKGFTPSARAPEARVAVAVSVVCADTEAEAERLAVSAAVWRLHPEGPARGPLLPPDEAARLALTPLQQERVRQHRAGMVVGDGERARKELTELAGTFGVDEVIVVTVCHDPAARLRSYRLLAEVFELEAGR
jgi:luciferase family oxidoreductase group 1